MRHRLVLFWMLSVIVSTLFAPSVRAQGFRGRDFWICFPANAVVENSKVLSLSLFITSDSRSHGAIQYARDTTSMPFSVEAGASMSIELDTTLEMTRSATVERKGIHIISDNDVSVYVASHRQSSTDSYVAIPTPLLGREYKVVGYEASNGFSTQFAVVATEDNTWVTVVRSAASDSLGRPGTIALGLRKGETYYLSTLGDKKADLTGSMVTADKPIAFVTGHRCAQVPSHVNYCDMLMEMEPPSINFGTDFVIPKFAGKDNSVIRVVANADGTEVRLDGARVALLSNGGFFECDTLRYDATVTTSKPALVAEYATSSEADSVQVGDPFMLLVTPNDRFEKSFSVASVMQGSFLHFLNFVVPREAIRSLSIDGRLIFPDGLNGKGYSSEYGQPIISIPGVTNARAADAGIYYPRLRLTDGGKYVIISQEITAGRHDVKCDQPIALYAYGFGTQNSNYDSYGHNCGERLDAPKP